MDHHRYNYCPNCATPLRMLSQTEDGGPKTRLRCPACAWTHWNNPTPVLAAIIEMADREGQVLLARNAAWTGRMFALITGFMEAGETPEDGIAREVLEETGLRVEAPRLVGVYDFQRMNQLIVAYHVLARGKIALSPELAEYRLFRAEDLKCWRAGTGYALADWLTARGVTPRWIELPTQMNSPGLRPRRLTWTEPRLDKSWSSHTEQGMEQVNIYEAKTQFSKYVELAESGQDVIIARGGKQVARLTAIQPVKRAIRFGVLKGKVRVAADFDAPLPDEVLAGFEGR